MVEFIQLLFPYYQKLTLLQFPHASLFSLGANAINGATTVYANNFGKPKLYWLHSLVLVVITAFGGGTVAPLLIGRPSMIVANDQIIVLCILAWYATQNLGMQKVFTWLPIKLMWTFFLGLFRTHSVVNVVIAATGILTPTIYYPIPLVGPIVVGTALGCLGMFLPFEKGLAPIKNNTPWNLQGALLTASFYHIMVHDKTGFLGVALRSVVGSYDAAAAKTIIATGQILSLELQALFNGDANLFTPVHKLLYLVLQVQGPIVAVPAPVKASVGWNIQVRHRLAGLVDMCRAALVVGAVVCYLRANVPAHSLRAVPQDLLSASTITLPDSGSVVTNLLQQSGEVAQLSDKPLLLTADYWSGALYLSGSRGSALRVGEVLGSCQYLATLRGCTPYLLRLEQTMGAAGSGEHCTATAAADETQSSCQGGHRLAVYQGSSIHSNSSALWALDLPSGDQALLPEGGAGLGDAQLHLSSAGALFLTRAFQLPGATPTTALSVLWTSGDRQRCAADSTAASLKLDNSGKPVILCSDGVAIPL